MTSLSQRAPLCAFLVSPSLLRHTKSWEFGWKQEGKNWLYINWCDQLNVDALMRVLFIMMHATKKDNVPHTKLLCNTTVAFLKGCIISFYLLICCCQRFIINLLYLHFHLVFSILSSNVDDSFFLSPEITWIHLSMFDDTFCSFHRHDSLDEIRFCIVSGAV